MWEMESIYSPVDLFCLLDLGYLLDQVDPWKTNVKMLGKIIDTSFLTSLIKILTLGLFFSPQLRADDDFKVTGIPLP